MIQQAISQHSILVQPRPRERGWISDWFARWRDRHALRDLSDATLKDIGLTRQEIEDEAARPLWRW
jgi:uncharacterized protein YjiS (DUF1127 family)